MYAHARTSSTDKSAYPQGWASWGCRPSYSVIARSPLPIEGAWGEELNLVGFVNYSHSQPTKKAAQLIWTVGGRVLVAGQPYLRRGLWCCGGLFTNFWKGSILNVWGSGSSWATCEAIVPQFSNSLPLFPRAGTATCWAPPSGTQEAQSRRKWTQPPGGVTPFIECKQKANNWDMVGLWSDIGFQFSCAIGSTKEEEKT